MGGYMIREERIKKLNEKETKNGRYILYWMQASHRTVFNQALEYAILKANKMNRPVVVYFGITDYFPQANERHYCFMLEGLREVQSSLNEKGIAMVVWHMSPELGAIELSKDASLVVVDRGYLRIQKKWRSYVAQSIDCSLVQVEGDVVVPVETASPKEEYSAATFRPKIKKKLGSYLLLLKENRPKVDSLRLDFDSFDIEDPEKALSRLEVDRSIRRVKDFHGGATEAKKHLEDFLKNKLDYYTELRNDPTKEFLSNMSPYLHFGQISPIYIALKILETDSPGKDAYLEELIVRRELSVNFVFYNQNYDSFDGLPNWAKKTLREHEKDLREQIYTMEELENADTHDPYWNAAQKEMIIKGKMHGYMRMYWGKKIIEWTRTPREAFKIALYLNNKYELDGRGPNGFTGVAWCFGKHDRPWKERQIFGKIRYMTAKGLRRKFDADLYVEKIGHIS
ncbi:MAG: deoxyribodipyrimidine photo-lyase [Candidatus Bathyarchaeia archaeon]